MLKKTVVLFVFVAFVLATVIALQPEDFRIARSVDMAVPPEVAFAQVNDLHAFQAWNPYARKDPAMKQTYQGPPAGVGAAYGWAGNQEVGVGHAAGQVLVRILAVPAHPIMHRQCLRQGPEPRAFGPGAHHVEPQLGYSLQGPEQDVEPLVRGEPPDEDRARRAAGKPSMLRPGALLATSW